MIFVYAIKRVFYILYLLLLQLAGGNGGGVNGDASEINEYAAKTHELQTIIEKQVSRLRQG